MQLNVNVETTIVSQIDVDKDHCDIEAMPNDTQTITAFERDEHYNSMDRDSSDRESEKYPSLV